jgi:hypothetical protein
MSDAMDRVTVQGHILNKRTVAMLHAAERSLGYELSIVQGSYNGGATAVAASAGTHDGGGAVDLLPWDYKHKVKVARTLGFAAWHRPELWVDGKRIWGEHIHCIAIGDAELSDPAKDQVTAYRHHRDGLAGNAPDRTWHPNPIPTFHYPPKSPPRPVRLPGVPGWWHVEGVEPEFPGLRGRSGPSLDSPVTVDPRERPNGFNLQITRVVRFQSISWGVTAKKNYYMLHYLKRGKST